MRPGGGPSFLGDEPGPHDHSSRTSVTLLGRLREDPKDQAAWVAKSEVKQMIREEIRKLETTE
jgi:hypothetical protein